MEKINPGLFEHIAGDTTHLLKNDNILDKEVKKMTDIDLT